MTDLAAQLFTKSGSDWGHKMLFVGARGLILCHDSSGAYILRPVHSSVGLGVKDELLVEADRTWWSIILSAVPEPRVVAEARSVQLLAFFNMLLTTTLRWCILVLSGLVCHPLIESIYFLRILHFLILSHLAHILVYRASMGEAIVLSRAERWLSKCLLLIAWSLQRCEQNNFISLWRLL